MSKELREIAKWEKELQRPKNRSYLAYLLLILCVVYIADEISTQIGTLMQSVVAQAVFAPVFGADVAVARMSAFSVLGMGASALAFLYKPLSDRYGRKPFLVINTIGMGLGMLLISVSANIPVYVLGAFVISFFIPNDMQQLYLFETVPPKHRATYYSIIKAAATLGMMLIPLLRDLLMGPDISRWRFVYLILAFVALAIAVCAACFVRETDPFMKKRLEYLRMSEAERAEAKREKGAEKTQGSVINALKFIFRHRQTRWLLIGGGFIMWGMVVTMYYETTMTYGYASQFLARGIGLAEAKADAIPFVTQALFLFPVGSAFFQLIQGFLSDKLGRKPTLILMSASVVLTFFLFYFGADRDWVPTVVGLLAGSAVGSYWAAYDICCIMTSESTPTNLRASVMNVRPMLSGAFGSAAFLAPLILINLFGDAHVGLISLLVAAPGMLIGLTLIALKVRETKHSNLEEIV